MDFVFGVFTGAVAMMAVVMFSIATSKDVEESPEDDEYDLSETIAKVKAKRQLIEDSHV